MEERPAGNRQGAPFALKSGSSDDVFVNVDTEGPTISAGFELNFEDNGRAVINFQEGDDYPLTEESIALFDANNNPIDLNSGSATLNRSGDLLCESCDFMQWGSWDAHLNYNDGTSTNSTNVFFKGWWVAGDITQDSDLPFTGSASYAGRVVGEVANNIDGGGWVTYTADGNLNMSWDFASRTGDLIISNFDRNNFNDGLGLTFAGPMCAPGIVGCGTGAGNHFGGPLNTPQNSPLTLAGWASGSFVNNGAVKAGGIIGNWNVTSSAYKATGIFGGSGLQITGN